MQYKKQNQNSYVIRIARGEHIVESITQFCQQNDIQGGFFYGLGAIDKAELAHYDVDTQKYSSKKYNQAFEVTNISGSIGMADKLIVHAHITLSDTDMKAIGGHLVEARVSGTIELYLTKTDKLIKKKDLETGLKLFDLEV